MKLITNTEYYFISKEGKVFNSFTNTYLNSFFSGSKKRDNRYKVVNILVAGKRQRKLIHRMVADAFIPNPNNLPQVNHKDGDKSNNHVDNLEWCNNSENQLHAYNNGLQIRGRGKLSFQLATTIRERYKKGEPQADLAREYEVNPGIICKIIKNQTYLKP